jgi:uncharacterized protein (DUF488 family)
MMSQPQPQNVIWTIGHSTHAIDEFIDIIRSFQIGNLVDIRMFPGSRRYPHFNKEALEGSLADADINYHHIVELGGRRKAKPDSKNTGWRLAAFRGYADYMETDAFHNGIELLKNIASKERTAYMCSEAVWWSCHRALVSDYLKVEGWTVMHIMGQGKSQEHPFTKPAKNISGMLSYEL